MNRLAQLAGKILLRAALAVLLVVATFILLMGLRGRTLPDLKPWHKGAPDGEFRQRDATPDFGFDDYLELEARLFDQLGEYEVTAGGPGGYSKYVRYVHDGSHNPMRYDENWNRSFEMVPSEIKGGVLLLHGLSDSPYSMRSVATLFHEAGFYALGMRMPGHGTVPAGLLSVTWKDWEAAVRIGARHVRRRIGPDAPFYLCGYSNGGALAVLYTIESTGDDTLPRPDRVFLFSPAIGITRWAFASNWHKVISWIPFFRKSKWLNIKPEYDPFKYNSFTKNAGAQAWALAGVVQDRLTRATVDGRLPDLPPIMTFQSAADSTIIARDVVERLFDRLPANGSELIAFDVNRSMDLDGFYRQDYRQTLDVLERADHDYSLTVVTNAGPDTMEVVARIKPAGAHEVRVEPLGLRWPVEVYSLAHVSIPFPPDDPIYGAGPREGDLPGLHLGDLSLRGETNVMIIPADELMRLRHNPFHPYMVSRIRAAVTGP